METAIGMCKVCPAYCPIEVTIENGKAIRVVGDRHSELYGGYTCRKGRALPEGHYADERLLHSLRRRADGSYETVDTGQAVDEIGDKLRAIIAKHGPEAVAVIVGNGLAANPPSAAMGAALLTALGTFERGFFSVGTIDQPGKLIAQALHGRWIPGPQSFRDSDVWILVGANPVISKMGLEQNPGRVIKDAVKGGMKLIVVDPRVSESSTHAFKHLQPKPGQDPTLIASFLNVIIAEELYDKAFVAQNAQGIETLAQHVAPFTPEYAAAITGVSADDIRLVARTFATAKRGCIVTGTGTHFALRGTLAEYLILCMNTICGRWVRAGERNTHPHVLLPEVATHAQPLPAYIPWDLETPNGRIHGLPKTILGATAGTLAEEILTPGKGQIRALICVGSNPAVSLPGQQRAAEALASLDLLVALDVSMSNTARMAHYVIPDYMVLETPGTTLYTEYTKYSGLWTHANEFPYAMYSPALVPPPPGSDLLDPARFFQRIARKLGVDLVAYANPAGVGEHWEKPPVAVPLPMDRDIDPDELIDILATGSRVPMAEIRQHPHGKLYDELDDVVLPRQADCVARLELGAETMMAELGEILAKRGDVPQTTDEFPLMLISRRSNDFYNSTGRHNPRLTGHTPYNPAFLSPDDLARFDIAEGDMVSVSSAHGEIVAVASVDTRLLPGTLSMSHCFGTNPDEAHDPLRHGSCTSALMDANSGFDPLFGQPRMSALPVAVKLVSRSGG